MWYSMNWQRFIIWMLPIYLRKPKTFSFLNALITPLEKLHNSWLVFRLENLYRLRHNGQTVYFRKALNDAFDNENRRIEIINGNAIQPHYIFTPIENKPLFISAPIYIYNSEDSIGNGADFIVKVPQHVIVQRLPQLLSEIKYYKQAGKRFKIERI